MGWTSLVPSTSCGIQVSTTPSSPSGSGGGISGAHGASGGGASSASGSTCSGSDGGSGAASSGGTLSSSAGGAGGSNSPSSCSAASSGGSGSGSSRSSTGSGSGSSTTSSTLLPTDSHKCSLPVLGEPGGPRRVDNSSPLVVVVMMKSDHSNMHLYASDLG